VVFVYNENEFRLFSSLAPFRAYVPLAIGIGFGLYFSLPFPSLHFSQLLMCFSILKNIYMGLLPLAMHTSFVQYVVLASGLPLQLGAVHRKDKLW
jgi:hypothetical protein